MRRTISSVTAFGGAIGISAIALKLFPIPFLWIGLTWAVTGFAIAVRAPSLVQRPLVMTASVSFAFALGEAVFALTDTSPPQLHHDMVPFPNKPDPLLGWKLAPSQVSHVIAKIDRGALIYDVLYSTDPMGHRISPPDRGDKVEGCLFFLADSITFGYGVNDDETFPYQVGLKSHGRFRVVNLAVNGYGAEHMLATMERDDLALTPCEPTYIFYVAAPHHILRAAGKVPELTYGPRYRLGPKGIPEYLGTKPPPPKWWRWRDRLHDQLSKSQIYRALPDRIRATEEDIELYFAIVREAFSRFKRRWPKAELYVIAWDLHDYHSNGQARFHQGLETVGAKVHFIDDILPGYTKDPTRYALHPFDLHPNPVAHEMVASYLIQRVLPPPRSP